VSKTTTQVQNMPEFQEQFLKETVLPIAKDIGTRDYEQYTGERVAAPTELQEQAYQQYANLQMPASMQAAMDPQQRQAAIMDIQDQMAPALNRQFAQQGIGEEAKAIKGGAFGGDRRFVYEGERQAALDANAYNLAAQELDRQAAQGLQGLQTQQAIAAAQMGAGEARRQIEQQGLDAGFQDYLDRRNFPLSNFGVLTGAAGAIPQGYGTTTSTSRDPLGGIGMGLQAFGGLGVGGIGPFASMGGQNLTFNPLGGLYGNRS
jgi:hypothetical protein